MLIAIAFAEEIQGLQRIALKFWASEFWQEHWFELKLLGLSAPQEPIFSSGSVVASMPKITRSQTWARTPQRFTPAQTSMTQTFCQSQRKLRISKLCNSWISSAMALAMSIYRTLCVLVSTSVPLFFFFFLKISLLEMLIAFQTWLLEMSLTNRFKNLYRGQLFKFCLRFFFFP